MNTLEQSNAQPVIVARCPAVVYAVAQGVRSMVRRALVAYACYVLCLTGCSGDGPGMGVEGVDAAAGRKGPAKQGGDGSMAMQPDAADGGDIAAAIDADMDADGPDDDARASSDDDGSSDLGDGSDSTMDSGGPAPVSCIEVSGAGVEPWFDLTVVGTQFDAYEGATIRIVAAVEAPYRFGVAEVTVVGGAFTVTLPRTLNIGLYTGVAVYIDSNHDEACEPNEHLWEWTTGVVTADVLLEVTTDQLCSAMFGGCRQWTPPTAACRVGIDTDLASPLPCGG